MYKPADMVLWQGRVDGEEPSALRWHQVIQPWQQRVQTKNDYTLLGFACDEGVRRNQGRPGSAQGPFAIRQALANLAYHSPCRLFDAGDVYCEGDELEASQIIFSEQIATLLNESSNVIAFGGGHEIAWGSFSGLLSHLRTQERTNQRIGIINFDAHFDLRSPVNGASSGTPFKQIALACEQEQIAFNYMVLGINPSANTETLFNYAREKNIHWLSDVECNLKNISAIEQQLEQFLQNIDTLYLTICMDVFPAHAAPGVSAPSPLGIAPEIVIPLIHHIKKLCEENDIDWRLSDIAETNPKYDIDNRTAKLAARLAYELVG